MAQVTVGDIIRLYRKEMGLTQKRLSELTGIAEITIRSYEAGKFRPKTEQMKKLSDALGIQISEMMDLY